MNIKDLEKGEHFIKDGNICALTYIKDKDEKDDLSKGEFIVKDNKLYQATPITNIKECIEKKQRTRPDYKRKIVSDFGNAIEYLSNNDYKIFFLDENKKKICIVKKFDGNQMLGTKVTTKTKEGTKTYFRKLKCYMPAGNFVFYLELSKTNHVSNYLIYLIPADKDILASIKLGTTDFYNNIHPHQRSDKHSSMCSGINFKEVKMKFNLDNMIVVMNAAINGDSDGKSLFHYNHRSPITRIQNCYYGKVAYDLHKQGLSDLEIIKRIRIKRGEI